MKEYWYTRVGIAVGLLLFFLAADVIFEDNFTTWTFILLTTTIIGFSHYFVGSFYQLQAFQRLEKPAKAHFWFLGLSAVAVIVSAGFLLLGQIALFSFVSIGYFMIHGFCNEITLYEKTKDKIANRWTIASVVLALLGLIFLSAAHPSSLFSPQLEYILRNDFLIQLYLSESIFPRIGLWAGVVSISIAVLLQLVAVFRSSLKVAHASFMVLLLISSGTLVFLYPPSYIHIFSAFLLYHFLVWFIFYLRRFSERSKSSLRQYIVMHILVFLPFIALLGSGTAYSLVDIFILNSYVFLLLTTIHITVSFMSENWFKERFLN